jgi:hypothetical protein
MHTSNGPSVAQALEIQMKKKVLIIGGIAAATLLVGGWALAQSVGHGPGGMRGMGMGMHGQMGQGMRAQMGSGMMGMGPGMMGMNHGSATAAEHSDIRDLFFNHESIKRTVTNLPDGIRTVTESDDPQVAATIKRHVAEMGKRVDEGRDPGLPIETPALHAIFRNNDKIKTTYEVTEKGIVVVQTSTDANAVKALQDHAAQVTDLAQRGMVAAHEAMMKNGGGMMGHDMRGTMADPQHED